MAVSATDIKVYLAANMPEGDSTTVGGAIDVSGRVLDAQFSAAAQPELQSSSASDTQNCTITGRAASGAIISETNALNGTTAVLWTNSFERILKIELASAAAGSITVKEGTGGTTRHTIAAGEDLVRTLFYGASAEASGGSDVTRYEKVFVKNTNGTDAALSLTVELTVDPRADYDLIVEDAKDDSNSSTNRRTLPTGNTGSYGDGPHSIPGTDLGAGEAIGVWVRQVLAAGTVADVDAMTVQAAFSGA